MNEVSLDFERCIGSPSRGIVMVYSSQGCQHMRYVCRPQIAPRGNSTWETIDLSTEAGRARMVEIELLCAAA